MDNLPMAPIVITSFLILFLIIFAIVVWCSDRDDDQSIDMNEVECLRLQIKTGSEDEFQWSRVFEIDKDQPPPYEFPPAYKNIYIHEHDRCIPMSP